MARSSALAVETVFLRRHPTYQFGIEREGYSPLAKQVAVAAADSQIEFVLAPVSRQSVTVNEKLPQGPESSAGAEVSGSRTKLPAADPPTVHDALPLIPGILGASGWI
jgi:hypothetical protein